MKSISALTFVLALNANALDVSIVSQEEQNDVIGSISKATGVSDFSILGKVNLGDNFYAIHKEGSLAFISGDGKAIISGEIINTDTMVSVNDKLSKVIAKEALSKLTSDDYISYKPEGEVLTHIWVFSDLNCPYCKSLHGDIGKYLSSGVEVRVIPFVRGISNKNSMNYKNTATVFSESDNAKRVKMYDSIINGKPVKSVAITSGGKKILDTAHGVGVDVGLRGTPLTITEGFNQISGYSYKILDQVKKEIKEKTAQ